MPKPDDYNELSVSELKERLAAAERVCILYGMTAPSLKTDGEKAGFILWQKWMELTADQPDIDQSEMTTAFVSGLARQRDMQVQMVEAARRERRKKDAKG